MPTKRQQPKRRNLEHKDLITRKRKTGAFKDRKKESKRKYCRKPSKNDKEDQ